MNLGSNDIFFVVLGSIFIGFVPLAAMVTTSYLKIVVVLGLVRNAIGVQQVPPNIVLSAISLILTAFIMAPVGTALMDNLKSEKFSSSSPKAIGRLLDAVEEPLSRFLTRHTLPADRAYFMGASKELWKGENAPEVNESSLLILVPAFTVRELTRAFQIGFIIYLGFIAVDLIIAAVIQALGFSMLSPTPIAIPFKLLLFVAFDGWQQLIYGLVAGYR
jgi:type III secretion protein R